MPAGRNEPNAPRVRCFVKRTPVRNGQKHRMEQADTIGAVDSTCEIPYTAVDAIGRQRSLQSGRSFYKPDGETAAERYSGKSFAPGAILFGPKKPAKKVKDTAIENDRGL